MRTFALFDEENVIIQLYNEDHKDVADLFAKTVKGLKVREVVGMSVKCGSCADRAIDSEGHIDLLAHYISKDFGYAIFFCKKTKQFWSGAKRVDTCDDCQFDKFLEAEAKYVSENKPVKIHGHEKPLYSIWKYNRVDGPRLEYFWEKDVQKLVKPNNADGCCGCLLMSMLFIVPLILAIVYCFQNPK